MKHAQWDAPVMITKTATMQSLADWVRVGYVFATQGQIHVARLRAFTRKFRDLYRVDLAKDQRYRRKRERLGNAVLVLWQHDARAPVLTWFLLVTEHRDHPAHKLETLYDVTTRRGRLTLDAYELVRVSRRGGAGKLSWTWQLAASRMRRWQDRFEDTIKRRDFVELRQAWWSLHKMPGFGPIRAQAKILRRFARAEWKRSMGNSPFPAANSRLWYVQRIVHETVPASSICAGWARAHRDGLR